MPPGKTDLGRRPGRGHKFEWRLAFRRPRANDVCGRGFLFGGHDWNTGFDDPGLFARNRLKSVAQPLFMVVADRRQDRNDGSNRVRRVEPASKPRLEDDEFAFAFFKVAESQY